MPALEALQDRLRKAHTQPLAVSVDSLYCHANWATSLGGISLPLLADFHPKGAVAKSFGLYLEDAGITDRATVICDANGVVHHASSVTPAGERNIEELVQRCEKLDRGYEGTLGTVAAPAGVPEATLYVKSRCGFSLRALNARSNLHLEDRVKVVNCTEDPKAKETLRSLTGKEQVPCLVVDGKPMLESEAIVQYLVTQATGFWG